MRTGTVRKLYWSYFSAIIKELLSKCHDLKTLYILQEKILAEALAEEEKARIKAEEERKLKEEQLRLEEENRQREERRKAREGLYLTDQEFII